MEYYFEGCRSVKEIKDRYHRLVHIHHPDKGGDTEIMKVINNQYHEALKGCNGREYPGTDGKRHTYTYNWQREDDLAAKVRETVGLNLDGIEIQIIGSWLWITGNTFEHKKALKGAGLRWHGKRRAWYWHGQTRRKTKYNPRVDLETLARVYGREYVKNERQEEKEEQRQRRIHPLYS